MDDLLEQFVLEGRELAQAATDDLLALEAMPDDAARLASAFRAFHTLKGSAGLFDFVPMGEALHAAEDLMGALRDGRRAMDRAVLDALLGCIGTVENWIEAVAANGLLPAEAGIQARGHVRDLRARLGAPAADHGLHDPEAGRPDAQADWLPALQARHHNALRRAGDRTLVAARYVPHADCFFMGDDPLALLRGIEGLVALDIAPRGDWSEPYDPFNCNLVFELISDAAPDSLLAALRLVSDQVQLATIQPAAAAPAQNAPGRTLRVDAARIDGMADIVGELIVASNNLAHLAAEMARSNQNAARPVAESQARFERLIGEMHQAVTGARMVPLAQTLRRLPRQVRELAGKLGKQVDFTLRGAETEADKAVADGLFEPLLHVLRNAIDHGIEPPSHRIAAGKPATGALSLAVDRAFDRLVVTVQDDGAGIDPQRLRQVAAGRGIATDGMDSAQLLDLVFTPGFSTAASITETSGRGVGMDAVRSAVQALGGTVTIASAPGQGCTIRLALPVVNALTSVILVQAGGERFGVPIEAVAETLRVAAGSIQPIGHGEGLVHRGQAVPVLRLATLLGLPPQAVPPPARILLVTQGDDPVAIEVDCFGDRMAVVLRPLAGLLAGLRFVLGSTLLGDGSVLLVLNLPDLLG